MMENPTSPLPLPLDWLLTGPPWVAYRTRIDLLHQAESDPLVMADREAMLNHPQIRGLITNLAGWPGMVVNTHKKAELLIYQMAFLADIGLKVGDEGIEQVCERVIAGQSSEGPFTVTTNIPPAYGGSGTDFPAWAACDYPVSLYALIKLGMRDHPAVRRSIEFMIDQINDVGWRCHFSKSFGNFKPPGKKTDPCPEAVLVCLQVLTSLPQIIYAQHAQPAINTLLNLWQEREKSHPYIFYMGNDFCKLKAPYVWYDILHVFEVLSHWDSALQHPALLDMSRILAAKADQEGKFVPESVYLWWKEWDFGQKKQPSTWLTFLVHRMLQRLVVPV